MDVVTVLVIAAVVVAVRMASNRHRKGRDR